MLKLLRSTYFLVKNRIPHTTVYPQLIELQVPNGDQILEQHINMNPLNAKYTSKFSTTMLIEAIDIWLDRKLLSSLESSPFFSILGDECQDISSKEELSICCKWLVNGCPEEHYMTTLHVKSTDATSIADTLTSFISDTVSTTRSLLDKGMTVQQLFLVSILEFKGAFGYTQHKLFTSTALATGCNLPLFKQHSLWKRYTRCLVP